MAVGAWRQVAVRVVVGLVGLLALQGLVGCASPPPTLPPGTSTIGEVMHVLSSELVAAGTIAPGVAHAQRRQALEARGLTDDDVRRGRIFVVRTMFDWTNTVSGIQHDVLAPEPASEGLDVHPGNVVGPRGSASLCCPGLEREGWVRPHPSPSLRWRIGAWRASRSTCRRPGSAS